MEKQRWDAYPIRMHVAGAYTLCASSPHAASLIMTMQHVLRDGPWRDLQPCHPGAAEFRNRGGRWVWVGVLAWLSTLMEPIDSIGKRLHGVRVDGRQVAADLLTAEYDQQPRTWLPLAFDGDTLLPLSYVDSFSLDVAE